MEDSHDPNSSAQYGCNKVGNEGVNHRRRQGRGRCSTGGSVLFSATSKSPVSTDLPGHCAAQGDLQGKQELTGPGSVRTFMPGASPPGLFPSAERPPNVAVAKNPDGQLDKSFAQSSLAAFARSPSMALVRNLHDAQRERHLINGNDRLDATRPCTITESERSTAAQEKITQISHGKPNVSRQWNESLVSGLWSLSTPLSNASERMDPKGTSSLRLDTKYSRAAMLSSQETTPCLPLSPARDSLSANTSCRPHNVGAGTGVNAHFYAIQEVQLQQTSQAASADDSMLKSMQHFTKDLKALSTTNPPEKGNTTAFIDNSGEVRGCRDRERRVEGTMNLPKNHQGTPEPLLPAFGNSKAGEQFCRNLSTQSIPPGLFKQDNRGFSHVTSSCKFARSALYPSGAGVLPNVRGGNFSVNERHTQFHGHTSAAPLYGRHCLRGDKWRGIDERIDPVAPHDGKQQDEQQRSSSSEFSKNRAIFYDNLASQLALHSKDECHSMFVPPPPPFPNVASTTSCVPKDDRGTYTTQTARQPSLLPSEPPRRGQKICRPPICEKVRGHMHLPCGTTTTEKPMRPAERQPGHKLSNTTIRESTEEVSVIPWGLAGSNSGVLWSMDAPFVSVMLTLPLIIPYGKVIKFGSPNVLPPASSRIPPAPDSSYQIPFGGPRDDAALGSSRSLGAKKSYYFFSPRHHQEAYTLFSHSGGICDTFAASLHVELAIIYVPPPLLGIVTWIFQSLAPRLPRLASPLKFDCGDLDERSAPGRFGGKVVTVSCAASKPEERSKFQHMQEFLTLFQSAVETLLRQYAERQQQVLSSGNRRADAGYHQREGQGKGHALGKKTNIWKCSVNCLRTALRSQRRDTASAAFQAQPQTTEHASGRANVSSSARDGGTEELTFSASSKEGSGGGFLDLTIRAFESKELDATTKNHARTMMVKDVCAGEVRLITTRSLEGRTCEIDPRFSQYRIGTRPILFGPDGQLCRHCLTDEQPLPDVWEVRLRPGNTREMQKVLVHRCILASLENRPPHEKNEYLQEALNAGITLWTDGKILLPSPPPASEHASREFEPDAETQTARKRETDSPSHSAPRHSLASDNAQHFALTAEALTRPAQVDRQQALPPLLHRPICREPLNEASSAATYNPFSCIGITPVSHKREERPFPSEARLQADTQEWSPLKTGKSLEFGAETCSRSRHVVDAAESSVPSRSHDAELSSHNGGRTGTVVDHDAKEGTDTCGRCDLQNMHQDYAKDLQHAGHRHAGMEYTALVFPPPGFGAPNGTNAANPSVDNKEQVFEHPTLRVQTSGTDGVARQRERIAGAMQLLEIITSWFHQKSGDGTDVANGVHVQQDGLGSRAETFLKQLLFLRGVTFGKEHSDPPGAGEARPRGRTGRNPPAALSRSNVAICEGRNDTTALAGTNDSLGTGDPRRGMASLARLLGADDNSSSNSYRTDVVLPRDARPRQQFQARCEALGSNNHSAFSSFPSLMQEGSVTSVGANSSAATNTTATAATDTLYWEACPCPPAPPPSVATETESENGDAFSGDLDAGPPRGRTAVHNRGVDGRASRLHRSAKVMQGVEPALLEDLRVFLQSPQQEPEEAGIQRAVGQNDISTVVRDALAPTGDLPPGLPLGGWLQEGHFGEKK